jgi:hypothetical protein
MPTYIGLYHPFMHFRDDGWVKLASLYWDQMARIVPPGRPTDDSEVVRRFKESGFIKDFPPDPGAMKRVGAELVGLVEQQSDALRDYFQKHPADALPVRQGILIPPSAPQPDPRMGYVLAEEKLSADLATALQEHGLAQPYHDMTSKQRWLAVPPKLATVYVARLAEEMCSGETAVAEQDRLIPTTDETVNHIAVSGCSIERLAQGLLGDADFVGDKPTTREVEADLASLAIQSVLPKDIEAVPAERFIELRERRSAELEAFRAHIHDRVASMSWLNGVTSQAELQARLELEAESLQRQQESLRDSLRSQGIDVVQSALNVSIAAPALFTSAEKMFHLSPTDPIIAGALGLGALAFSLLPIFRDAGKKRAAAMQGSPAAYLLSVENDLEPSGLTSRIAAQAGRFRFPLGG